VNTDTNTDVAESTNTNTPKLKKALVKIPKILASVLVCFVVAVLVISGGKARIGCTDPKNWQK
jgi:hypothetical protein